MTLQQTGIIMDILKTAYPRFYAGQSAADRQNAVRLWSEMFAEDDVSVVAAAVKALIAGDGKGFPPHIGAVKAHIRQLTAPREMTEGEAWALVSKAIRNSAYASAAEFDRLPDEIRRIVGSPSQLRDWSTMDSGTVHSVVASNFQRAYRARQEQTRLYAALPRDVKALVQRLAGKQPEALPATPEARHDTEGGIKP